MLFNTGKRSRQLRCGSVAIAQLSEGYSVHMTAAGERLSLGLYPELRDAVEIPLSSELPPQVREDLHRLQSRARAVHWDNEALFRQFGDVPAPAEPADDFPWQIA